MPVLVWIHGGGFVAGAPAEKLYHGEWLAKKGVVVVSIAYRLGLFGFLAHPELSAESLRHVSGPTQYDATATPRGQYAPAVKWRTPLQSVARASTVRTYPTGGKSDA